MALIVLGIAVLPGLAAFVTWAAIDIREARLSMGILCGLCGQRNCPTPGACR